MSLTWVAALSAVMWVPYILNAIAVRGLMNAVGYPEEPAPLAGWAQRMKNAHYNSVENLIVFATLVLVANAAGISNDVTVLACETLFLGATGASVVLHLRRTVGANAIFRRRLGLPGRNSVAGPLIRRTVRRGRSAATFPIEPYLVLE